MITTLNKIREHSLPTKKLLRTLGKKEFDDEPLSLITILDNIGLDSAILCLSTVDGYDREKRLFAVWCAREVQPLMKDHRSIDALDVAKKFANNTATQRELTIAEDAAWNAVHEAVVQAAGDAVHEAAVQAMSVAAWTTLRTAAYSATWAARAAARSVGCDWDDSRDAQESKFREIFGGEK